MLEINKARILVQSHKKLPLCEDFEESAKITAVMGLFFATIALINCNDRLKHL